jgi:hypothetical protein
MDCVEEQKNELEALSEIYYNEIEGKQMPATPNNTIPPRVVGQE